MELSKECCPLCLSVQSVRPKMLLISEAWENAGSTDRRVLFGPPLRVGAIKSEYRFEPPLEQFIKGYYCDQCEKGFASEEILIDKQNRHETMW